MKEKRLTQFGKLPDVKEEMLQLVLTGINRSFAGKGEEEEHLRTDGYTKA